MNVVFISDNFEVECLAFGYLSAYLKAAGHFVRLIKTDDQIGLASLLKSRPDVLCYSVTTGYHKYYEDIHARLCASLGSDVLGVFGGPHPTFFPSYCGPRTHAVTVRGEGFEAVVDIVNSYEKSGMVDPQIPNTNLNPLRPQIDKDTLLRPDRELMYTYESNYNNPIKNVMCSFGCMFACPYCYNEHYRKLYKGYTQTVRPLDEVYAELCELQEYPLELVYFQDDLFPVFSSNWLVRFCRMYSSIQVPFHVQLRAEFVTDTVISQLAAVGLHGVTFAVETGDPLFRRDVLRRAQTDETILNAAKVLRRYKIRFRIENMLGAPGESAKQALTTVRLNAACKPTFGWASLFQPYPRTKLGDLAISTGQFDGNVDRISRAFSDTYLLTTPDKHSLTRMQRLFGLAVRFKLLRWLLPVLVHLPLGWLYTKLGSWYKRFSYKYKLYNV